METHTFYDGLGRVVRVVNPARGARQYGRARQICVDNTSAGDCQDDGIAGDTATTLLNLVYWHDAAGNITTAGDRSPGHGYATVYGYDALHRLVSAGAPVTETYSYDAIGNLTSKAGLSYTYNYNGATHKHAVTSLSNRAAFVYDANGNMTQRVEMSPSAGSGQATQRITYTQEWDVENKLVAVTKTVAGQVTRFYRDADGALVKSRQSSAASSQMTWLHADHPSTSSGYHLGSASLTTNVSGQKLALSAAEKRAGLSAQTVLPAGMLLSRPLIRQVLRL